MSLVSLCIRRLLPFADEIRVSVRLHLRSSTIDELIPDPANVDTRLWAVLIQLFDNLPSFLTCHTTHSPLPLLQSIPSTPTFSLITLLDLPACPHLNDTTVLQFTSIYSLTAFDAACSALSSYALKSLIPLAQLRILSLRKCRLITNDALPYFIKFPLLSVLDLRGTHCNIHHSSFPFQPSSHHLLYYPTPLKSALTALHALHSDLYSSPNPYFLHINALRPPSTHRQRIPTVAPQDAFFVIPSDNSRIQVGSTHTLEERERELAHERNKDAWYQRRDIVQSLSNHAIEPDITPRPLRRLESSVKHIPSTSRMTNSLWIGASKYDPMKQNTRRHSFSPPSTLPLLPLPQPSSTFAQSFDTRPPKRSLSTRIQSPPTIPQANRTCSASAQSFYNPLPKRSLPSRSFPSQDDHLKLYRPAPPWSALNEYLTQVHLEETAEMERQERRNRPIPPEEEMAQIDMSSAKAMLAKQQLDEWALAQSQVHRKKTTLDMSTESKPLSRNPFRKQELTKVLKPLTTFKVPILTPEVRKAALARERMVDGLNLKRKTIAVEEDKDKVDLMVATSSGGFDWKGWSKKAS